MPDLKSLHSPPSAPSPRSDGWVRTPLGDPRGYIQPARLDELWLHTGTNCNLACPFCLEGSRPGDDRVELLTFADAQPFIDEALTLGVRKFSFTGGEPFLNPATLRILDYALEYRPCLVLTNATAPLVNKLARIEVLRERPHPLSFRVSLDHADPAKHDAGRGKGNFKLALRILGRLHRAGFGVSLARLMEKGEDAAAVNAAFVPHLEEAGLPAELRIVPFPDYLGPGALPEVPHITTSCMTTYLTEAQRDAFMCSFSKMLVKTGGRVGVYACTLVDDDPDFDLGSTLTAAMGERVQLKHHRCYSCFAYGASCSEGV